MNLTLASLKESIGQNPNVQSCRTSVRPTPFGMEYTARITHHNGQWYALCLSERDMQGAIAHYTAHQRKFSALRSAYESNPAIAGCYMALYLLWRTDVVIKIFVFNHLLTNEQIQDNEKSNNSRNIGRPDATTGNFSHS